MNSNPENPCSITVNCASTVTPNGIGCIAMCAGVLIILSGRRSAVNVN